MVGLQLLEVIQEWVVEWLLTGLQSSSQVFKDCELEAFCTGHLSFGGEKCGPVHRDEEWSVPECGGLFLGD